MVCREGNFFFGGSYLGPRLEGIVYFAGKLLQQKLKAPSHMASTTRKQRMTNACSNALHAVQEQVSEQCYLKWATLPTSVNAIRIVFPQVSLKAHLPYASRFCQGNITNHHNDNYKLYPLLTLSLRCHHIYIYISF